MENKKYRIGDVAEMTGVSRDTIRFHEQVIARLKLSLEDCLSFCRHREKVRLEQFPAAYMIVPRVEKEQSEELYMEYAHRYPGMDMMYTMEEYELDAQAEAPDIAYQDTSLILYQNQAEYVEGYSFPEKTIELSEVSCVSLFQTSEETRPQPELVTDMLQWAAARDLKLSRKLYTMIAMHGVKDGNFVYYRKLYIPVVSSEKKEFLMDTYGRIAG